MNLTAKQWLAMAGIVLSAIVVSTAYFTDMFGPVVAKQITGTAAFLNLILGGVLTYLTGQRQTVRDVLAMPGIDTVTVNANANQTLATIATDQTQNKIMPTPADTTKVVQTAKGE